MRMARTVSVTRPQQRSLAAPLVPPSPGCRRRETGRTSKHPLASLQPIRSSVLMVMVFTLVVVLIVLVVFMVLVVFTVPVFVIVVILTACLYLVHQCADTVDVGVSHRHGGVRQGTPD